MQCGRETLLFVNTERRLTAVLEATMVHQFLHVDPGSEEAREGGHCGGKPSEFSVQIVAD